MSRFAMRYSINIQGDLQRGWSAWTALRGATLRDLVDSTPEFYDLAEAEEAAAEDGREFDIEDFIASRPGDWTVGYDESAPEGARWCWWHHDGLACYALDAETVEEALAEAARFAGRECGFGFGHMTEGKVELIASLDGDWHLLKCDDLSPEPS